MIHFICGAVSGVLTGLGVGGGLVLIVLLNYLSSFNQLEIQSFNLLYYIPTAIFSLFIYSKERNVDYKVGVTFIVIAAVTAILGANMAHFIDVALLKKLFAVYLLLIGVLMLIQKKNLVSNKKSAE
ncbi:MAG: sulfite exporter TauE/SafE family protein [Clostridia bacterium]|nr:sulfite exporter TauE/SafE family protein [Clostridia bacterium]